MRQPRKARRSSTDSGPEGKKGKVTQYAQPRSTHAASRASFLARLARSYRRQRWIGYLFIMPWLISFLWFDLIPFALNVYLSLTDYSVGTAAWPNWVGLANYVEMFTRDDRFRLSISNTIYYMGLSVPLGLIVAFGIALLLNARIRGQTVYRTIYYIPSLVPVVATSIIFFGMFNTRYGVLNQMLALIGIQPIRWLSRPEWIKPSMIIMSLWGFGAQMVIFLAGLQGISQELYEAVEVDGGGAWHKLRYVTVPMMTPSIFFNLVIGVINSFQVFTSVFVLLGTSGGPLNSGLFYVVHIYNNAFRHFLMGYASALSLILFLIILVFTLLLVRTSGRWVYYGGE